ncbi:MAG: hypothetical protein AAF411_29070 [Myxococcota bacterium]
MAQTEAAKGSELPRLGVDDLEPALPSDLLEDLRRSTQDEIRRSGARPLGRVRALPTGARRMMMLAVIAILGAASLVTGTSTMAVVVFLVLSGLSFWLAMRPIHKAPLPGWVGWSLAVVSLATATVVALLAPSGDMPLAAHVGCFVPGVVLSLALLAVLRFLTRGPFGFVPFAGTVGAGLAANGFLAGRCHVEQTTAHLLMGHGSVLVVLVAVTAVVGALGARR